MCASARVFRQWITVAGRLWAWLSLRCPGVRPGRRPVPPVALFAQYREVQELAWKGCDDDEIASYSGHTSKEMIRKYAGEARQIMRARQARAKRS